MLLMLILSIAGMVLIEKVIYAGKAKLSFTEKIVNFITSSLISFIFMTFFSLLFNDIISEDKINTYTDISYSIYTRSDGKYKNHKYANCSYKDGYIDYCDIIYSNEDKPKLVIKTKEFEYNLIVKLITLPVNNKFGYLYLPK